MQRSLRRMFGPSVESGRTRSDVSVSCSVFALLPQGWKRLRAPSQSHRRKPAWADGADDMVLVLDELGPWPEMVHGIIAQHGALREDIKRAVNCTGNVHIVLVGTGVEGVTLDVGSSTDD